MIGMNLALITQDFPPEVGGIETYAKELAKRFDRQCDRFLVVAPDKPLADSVDRSLPYPVKRIKASNPFLGAKAFPQAPVIFRQHKIENVFHTQWQTLPASVFSRQRGVVKNIFVAAHARELLFNPFEKFPIAKQWYEQYRKWMLSQVDLFFPVSDYTADLLRSYEVEDHRIKKVINGTDPAKFYPADTRKARKFLNISAGKVLLSITRLVSRKGIDTALLAFKETLKNHPDSLFVIVGEGESKGKLQKLASKLGISEAVQFTGRVPHEHLNDYYNACDVFVMPSKTEPPNVEGFGIVFLEANACGKPVIGTFSGGIPSAIVNGETGILVDESEPESLAEAIDLLFSNPEKAIEMGKKGKKRVEEVANWDISAAALMGYMKDKI